jgi:hypothetical protein
MIFVTSYEVARAREKIFRKRGVIVAAAVIAVLSAISILYNGEAYQWDIRLILLHTMMPVAVVFIVYDSLSQWTARRNIYVYEVEIDEENGGVVLEIRSRKDKHSKGHFIKFENLSIELYRYRKDFLGLNKRKLTFYSKRSEVAEMLFRHYENISELEKYCKEDPRIKFSEYKGISFGD